MSSPALALIGSQGEIEHSTRVFRRRYEDRAELYRNSPQLESVLAGSAERARLSLEDGIDAEFEAVTDTAGVRHALMTLRPEDDEPGTAGPNQLLGESLDESRALIWLKDLEGKYLRVNTRFTEMLGVTTEEVRGKSDSDLPTARTVDGPRALDRDPSLPEPLELEYSVPQFDGRPAMIAIRFAVRDPKGDPVAVCGVAAPVPEARMAREEAEWLTEIERCSARDASSVRIQMLQEWGVVPSTVEGVLAPASAATEEPIAADRVVSADGDATAPRVEHALLEEHNDIREAAQRGRVDADQARADADNLRSEADAARRESAEALLHAERLERDLGQWRQQAEHAQADSNATRARLEQSEAEAHQLRARLEEADADHRSLRARLEEAEADHRSLRIRMEETEAAAAEARRRAERAESERLDADAMRLQAEGASKDVSALRAELASAKADGEAERAEAIEARRRAESAAAEASAARAQAETANKDLAALRAELAAAKSEAERQRSAAAQAQQGTETAESARAAAEVARLEADSARLEAETARAEVESARVEAETARAEVESARVEVESARVKVESARADAEAARAEAAAAQVQVEAARAEAARTCNDAAAAHSAAEAAQAEVAAARGQAEAAQAEVAAARRQAEGARTEAAAKAEELTTLGADLAAAHAAAEAERARAADAVSAAAELRHELERHQADAASHHESLAAERANALLEAIAAERERTDELMHALSGHTGSPPPDHGEGGTGPGRPAWTARAQRVLVEALAGAEDWPQALERALATIGGQGGWTVATAWMPSALGTLRSAGSWTAAADRGALGPLTPSEHRLGAGSVAAQAIHSPSVSWLADLDGAADERLSAAAARGLRSGVLVPVRAAGATIALLELLTRDELAPDPATALALEGAALQIGRFAHRLTPRS